MYHLNWWFLVNLYYYFVVPDFVEGIHKSHRNKADDDDHAGNTKNYCPVSAETGRCFIAQMSLYGTSWHSYAVGLHHSNGGTACIFPVEKHCCLQHHLRFIPFLQVYNLSIYLSGWWFQPWFIGVLTTNQLHTGWAQQAVSKASWMSPSAPGWVDGIAGRHRCELGCSLAVVIRLYCNPSCSWNWICFGQLGTNQNMSNISGWYCTMLCNLLMIQVYSAANSRSTLMALVVAASWCPSVTQVIKQSRY